MTISLYETDGFEQMEKVWHLNAQGKSELAIARQLGIKRTEVVSHLTQYRHMLANDRLAQDVARDYLNQMVDHYNMLIDKSYNLLNDLNDMPLTHQLGSVINATIKTIADLDAKRVDLLQKAGLLEGAELGDELAESERKQEIILDILRNDLCEKCQGVVARRLSEISGQAEVVKSE